MHDPYKANLILAGLLAGLRKQRGLVYSQNEQWTFFCNLMKGHFFGQAMTKIHIRLAMYLR